MALVFSRSNGNQLTPVDLQSQTFRFVMCLAVGVASAIMSGELAHNGDFPNAVAILRSGEVIGGGTLVSPVHVITSCRIIGQFEPPVVEEYHRNRTKDFRPFVLTNLTLAAGSRWIYSLEGGQSRKAGDSYPHPSCVDTKFDIWLHDIGVIEAAPQFVFGETLHALYFWTSVRSIWKEALDDIVESRAVCSTVGWGRNGNQNFSEWLIFARITLVPPTDCVEFLCTEFNNTCDANLNDVYFETRGKLCARHTTIGGPSNGDLGNGIYCGGFFYGVITNFYVAEEHGLVIFDRVDFSFDLYRTLVLEARELDEVYFPIFKTVVLGSATILEGPCIWIAVPLVLTVLKRISTT